MDCLKGAYGAALIRPWFSGKASTFLKEQMKKALDKQHLFILGGKAQNNQKHPS